MGDARTVPGSRQQPFEARSDARQDLLLRSESPRVQQILLHQQLKDDIEKNSARRVRYVDSALYVRNHQRPSTSGLHDVQVTTQNSVSTPQKLASSKFNQALSIPSIKDDISALSAGLGIDISGDEETREDRINRCQVCRIKEVTQGLMNINSIIQDRNEQISRLKAKLKAQSLRSYFERQMKD